MHTFKKSAMKYKDANGVMQDVGVMCSVNETDTTLTKSGVAADAKVSGDKLSKVNTDITELNRQIKVERERINTFTTLGEGSTTGDAELADARVDKDGNTHGNVGEHIRSVSAQLSNEIDEKLSDLDNKANVIVNTKSGETITATDSSNAKFRGMNVYGKSKQESTTGKNLFDVSQIIANNNLSISGEKITVITSANSSTVSTGKTLKQLCPSLEVGVSCILTFETTGSNKYVYLDTAKTVWNIGQTITITQDMLNSTLQLYASGVSTTATITNMMIRLASITDATYEKYTGGKASPSPQYPQAIENCENTEVGVYGKNLLSYPYEETTKTVNGITFTDNGDGSITVNGTSTDSVSFSLSYFPVMAGQEYFYKAIPIKGSFSSVYSYVYSISGKEVFDTGDGVKFVPENTIARAAVVLMKGQTLTNLVIKPQIELGSKATDYEPYKKQSLTIPYTLCGIPVSSGGNYTDDNGQEWVCDEIDMERGVYVQRVKRLYFDGDESISLQSINSYGIANYGYLLTEKAINNYGICNMGTIQKTIIANTTESGIFIAKDVGYIRISSEIANTVEAFKTWLKTHPYEICYILETPIETPLTEEQIAAYKALRTNYPTTTILNNNNAGMMVKYGADTKLYIDNKFAELAAQLV